MPTRTLSSSAARRVHAVCLRLAARVPLNAVPHGASLDYQWLRSLAAMMGEAREITEQELNTLAALAETFGEPEP